jgi:MoxR-like ATPase
MRGNVADLEVEGLAAVTSAKEIVELQQMIPNVVMPESVERYIVDIIDATRSDPSITLGASPRASITMAKASRVMAAADGRWTVYPEDVRALLRPVLAHRIMLSPDAILRGEDVDNVLDRVTNRVKAPLGVETAPPPKPALASRNGKRAKAGAR